MTKEAFAHKVSLPVEGAVVWQTVTDVPTLVSWVSVLNDVQVLSEMERYTARLEDRIGLFALKADLEIAVLEYVEGEWIVVRAEGEDRQVASRILVNARVDLAGSGSGTDIEVSGTYEVTGKVATLGAGMIKKKANRLLEEFFDGLTKAFA